MFVTVTLNVTLRPFSAAFSAGKIDTLTPLRGAMTCTSHEFSPLTVLSYVEVAVTQMLSRVQGTASSSIVTESVALSEAPVARDKVVGEMLGPQPELSSAVSMKLSLTSPMFVTVTVKFRSLPAIFSLELGVIETLTPLVKVATWAMHEFSPLTVLS